LLTRTPILPAAVIGGEEPHFSLGNSRLLASFVNRLIALERADSFPLLLNILPLPANWRIEFCEPIDLAAYAPEAARDPLLAQQLTERVRMRIQESLANNLKQRTSMLF
jgi:1-acyl-sn-glycerol-3-phosphate acyltransferase